MIQINPLQSYIDGGARAAITNPPSASLVFDLPGRAIWVKGVRLKGTDHTYTFSHDNYISITNTPDQNNLESEDILIGINTTLLKQAIDTTYGVVGISTDGLAPMFSNTNKASATAATTYNFLGIAGTTLKWYQLPWRNIRINTETTDVLGIDSTDPLIISSGDGISVTWDSTNKRIVITNSKPHVFDNTDFQVSQYVTSNNYDYRILFKRNANDEDETGTTRYSSTLTYNPSTKTLKINSLKVITVADIYVGATSSADATVGLVPTATSAQRTYFLRGDGTWTNMAIADTWRPIKVNSSEKLGSGTDTGAIDFVAGTGITLGWDATNKKITITNSAPDVNHNTHYTTMMYVGENNDTKANKQVSNPYLKLFDDDVRRATFQIKAGTGITVGSDANGNITITNSAPDVDHNTDRTGIKLTAVTGTKKTDDTVILANSAAGLNIQGGTNKFSIGDGTNYIEIPITPSFTVTDKAANILTSATTLATINGTDITAKVTVVDSSPTLTTSLKTIATIAGVEIKAKITNYNTDFNVQQTPKTDNVNRPLMMINGGTSAGEQTSTSMFSTGIYANASSKMIIANGFVKAGSDSSYVLLGDGTHKALSDFAMSDAYVKKIGDTMSGRLNINITRSSTIFPLDMYTSDMLQGDLNVLRIGQSATTGNGGLFIFKYNGDNSNSNTIHIGFHNNYQILNILNSGNIGIGTTTPGYKLDVLGDIYTTKLVFPHGGSTYSWERINEGYYRTSIRAYCTAGEEATGARDKYTIGLMVDGYYSFAIGAYGGGATLCWRDNSGTWYNIYHSGNLPAYPTVNNASLTLQTAGTTLTTFYANDATNRTFNVTCANIGAAVSGHNHDDIYVNVTGDTMTGALTGTRIWLNYNSNLSPSYSWTNSALTVPSIEILNYTGDSNLLPTLAMHWYGHGGPQITVDKTSLMWITSAEPNSAGTLPTSTTYFKNLLLKCSDAIGIYINGNKVFHEGNLQPYPKGFSGFQTNNNWINNSDLTFTLLGAWLDGYGGEISFYTNKAGQAYQAIDGAFYQRRDAGGCWRVADLHDLAGYSLTSHQHYWANLSTQTLALSNTVPTFGDINVVGGENTGLKLKLNTSTGYSVIRFLDKDGSNPGYIHYFHNYSTAVKHLNISGDSSTLITLGTWTAPSMVVKNGSLGARIGMGIVSPNYKLDIVDTQSSDAVLSVTNNQTAKTYIPTARFMTPNMTAGGGETYIRLGRAESSKNSGWIGFYYAGDSSNNNFVGLGLHGVNNGIILNGASNVGIGTITPTSKLHVIGTTSLATPLVSIESSNDYASVANMLSLLSPSLTATHMVGAFIGKSCSNYNSGQFRYDHVADGSNSNIFNIGVYGVPDIIKILGSRNVYINGEAHFKSPSASQTIHIGYNTTTWYGGASTHPMIWGGDGSTYYTMIAMPHIPFLLNGYNSYTGGTFGAIIRIAGNKGTSGSYWDIGCPTEDLFEIKRSGSRFVAVTNGGNVGIGTYAPSYKLDVIGSSTSGIDFHIRNTNNGTNAYTILRIGNDSNETCGVMFINGSARTTDGGAKTFTIRNDAGVLRLGNASYETRILGSYTKVLGRLRVGYNSNIADDNNTYSWQRAALTVPSIEIVNKEGTDDDQSPTLTFHHYGYGGPTLSSYKGEMYIKGGADYGALLKQSGGVNGYFKRLHIYPNQADGVYLYNSDYCLTSSGTTERHLRFNVNSVITDFGVNGNDAFIWDRGSTRNIQFGTNNTSRMIITAAGNVGIGTTSPSYKLHVNGTGYISSTLYVAGQPAIQTAAGAGKWNYIRMHNGSNFFDFATISSSNDGALEIRPAGASNIGPLFQANGRVEACSTYSNNIGYGGSAMWIREYHYGGAQSDSWGIAPRLGWHWAGRQAAQIALASNGFLYESPQTGTSFYRIVLERSDITWGLNINGSAGRVLWTGVIDKLHGGNEFNMVHAGFSSTNFWFNYVPWDNRSGTASLTTYIMGNGNKGYADVTARHFYDASDIRLKENIKPISNLFPIREFTWKSDKTKSYGFIAQELQLLGLNELVQRNDKTEMLTVNYLSALCLYLALLSNIVEKQLKEILELKLELKKIKKD